MPLNTSFRTVVKTSLLKASALCPISYFKEKREKVCDEQLMSRIYGGRSEISGSWEKYYATLRELPKRYRKFASFVVEALPTFKNQGIEFVLDLGCGAGRHSVYLARNGFDVVGVDVSKSALRIAKEWAREENLGKVRLVQAAMTHVPFKDNQFDAVISVSVVHHAVSRDIEETVDEIHRILKRNGTFLANLASVKDPRYGKGEMVEANTFKMLEAFEERQFAELHHFFTRQKVSELLARFSKTEIKHLRTKPHYWKVTAVK